MNPENTVKNKSHNIQHMPTRGFYEFNRIWMVEDLYQKSSCSFCVCVSVGVCGRRFTQMSVHMWTESGTFSSKITTKKQLPVRLEFEIGRSIACLFIYSFFLSVLDHCWFHGSYCNVKTYSVLEHTVTTQTHFECRRRQTQCSVISCNCAQAEDNVWVFSWLSSEERVSSIP